MKKLLTFFLTALLTFTISWAETTVVTASRVTSSSVTWTGSGGETWNVNVNGGATNLNMNSGYAQVGSSSSPSTSITFSTSGITGTITSIVVDCASYQGKASVNATVGGNNFGNQGQSTPAWSNNTGGNVTFSGSASGAIVITMNNGSGGRAMYIKSITVTYTGGSSPTETCATPTFSPAAGTYTEAQSVTISTTTSGARIYYTTDGSTPNASNGTLYTGAINVSENMTIKAIAVKTDCNDSQVAEAAYIIISGGGSDSKIYRKVTSTDDLIPGQKYIIVYENGNSSYAMGTMNGNYGSAIGVSVSNNQVNIANATGVVEFILGGNTNAWTLFMGDNYLGYSGSGTNLATNSSTPNNNYYWTIDNSAVIQNNGVTNRYIRFYTTTPSFRAYTTTNGAWAYLYVQATSDQPSLHATPNPLNINDTNEASGKTGTIYVSGENLGGDNVGMTFNQGHSTNFSSNPGYFSHNGTVTDYPVAITYTGHALSATGIVYPGNNVVNTSVNINYLYTGPIYVIGDVNNTHWETSNGAQMTRDENGVYSTTVSVQQSDGTAGYFTFTKQLGSNFTAGQFGPVSSGNWWYNDDLNDIYQPIDTLGNKNNIRILPGTYTITVNPATNEFKIKRYVIDVTISPADGTHFTGSTISGTITSDPAGTIEWSTDGTNWQSYTDGFTATVDQVGGSVTVYARSTSNGVTSTPVSATYTRDLAPAPEAPSFSIRSSAVAAGTVITITAPEGCTLYVDGQQVASPYIVTINEGTTISAYCVNDEGTPSTTETNTYTIAAVCNAVIMFKDNDSDATSATTWDAIYGDEENNYFEAGRDYISEATDMARVYKATTGLKFGNSSFGGTITFNLDSDTEWKVSHITLSAKSYKLTNGTNTTPKLTVTTNNGQSETTDEIGSALGGYTLDFDGSAITSITISSDTRAYLKGFTITYACVPEIADPTISPESQTVGNESLTVTVTPNNENPEGAVTYYTTDGSDPRTSSTRIEWTSENSEFDVTATTTVNAVTGIEIGDTFVWSNVVSETYTFIEPTTLAWIENNGVLETDYIVADELIGTWAVVNDNTRLLWAKDQGNLSIDKRPAKTAGQMDYVKDILKYPRILDGEEQQTWDESNWVILDFGGINADPDEFVGHKISAKSIIGEYTDAVNHTITLKQRPDLANNDPFTKDVPEYLGWTEPFPEDKLGKDYDLAYNSYVPANFMTENHNRLENGNVVGGFVADETALPGLAGDSLYFVNPKIQEVAHIWAVWNVGDEETGTFTVYEAETKEYPNGTKENINAWNLNGTFNVKWIYNRLSERDNDYGRPLNLVPSVAYEFHAAIQRRANRLTVDPQGTVNPGTPSPSYMLYPLDMSNDGTPTAVQEINVTKTVVGVSYYNLIGVESKKPFDGVNIVVTRYSDGSTSTAKVLR